MAFFLGSLAATALDPFFLAVAFVAYWVTRKSNIRIRVLVFMVLGLILAFIHAWLSSVATVGVTDVVKVSTFVLGFVGFMVDVGVILLIAKIINLFRAKGATETN